MPLGWVKERFWPERPGSSNIFDLYVSSSPCLQNAVDALAGWNTSFPPQYQVKAGSLATYHDPRILWAIERFGSLEGRHVLELGPLEGGHTSMLDAAGAKVDAIEANQVAFLRCLITREILGLTRSNFWLGDFLQALENWDQSYDLIVACGVLHQLKDPLHLIELAAKRANALYIWTHLITEESMPPSDPRRNAFGKTVECHRFHGIDVRAYRRTRPYAEDNLASSGATTDEHRWLHRDDLLEALKLVGFHDINTCHDEPDHRHGPALSVFARK